jgi:hypothetical protein
MATGGPGLPADAPPVQYDPGDGLAFGRYQVQPSSPFNTNSPSPSPLLFMLPRTRTDVVEVGALLAAPLNGMTGINGPGAPLITIVSVSSGSGAVIGAGVQTASAATALPGQPTVAMASDGSSGEHVSSFTVGPTQRVAGMGSVETARLTRTPGRSNLANTLAQPVPWSSSTPVPDDGAGQEEKILTPRGAELIAEALPFVGDSLERSLDDFVRQLKEVDVAGLGAGGPMPIVVVSVAVLSAASSAVVVREIVRRRSARGRGLRVVDSLGREFALSFPELPRSWSEKR